MKPNLSNNPDECWQAVLARSAAADGQFVFAVQTTGIFVGHPAALSTRCVKTCAFSRCAGRVIRRVSSL